VETSQRLTGIIQCVIKALELSMGECMSGNKKMTQRIEARIPVMFFEEDNKIIAYSPALDLSTCGYTEEQARKRFLEASQIFFDELIKMGTIEDVLSECGWRKVTGQKTWAPPIYRNCTVEPIQIPAGAY
jgi:hypothetical protein